MMMHIFDYSRDTSIDCETSCFMYIREQHFLGISPRIKGQNKSVNKTYQVLISGSIEVNLGLVNLGRRRGCNFDRNPHMTCMT